MTEHEAFAVELAAAAAAVTLPLFRTDCGLDNKDADGFDPVTEADRATEATLRQLIGARYPQHGVIGEEYGADRPDAEFVWVLDPIDGTRAFISGLPLWTTLIGLTQHQRPVVGVVAQPYLQEVFVGGASGARLLRGNETMALRVRSCSQLAFATLATTDEALFAPDDATKWRRLRAACRLTRLGCDAYAYAMVAAGYLDVVAENGLKRWDWTALAPLIEAAGGRMTDWTGRKPEGEHILAVGDHRLLEPAVAVLGYGLL